MKTTDPRDPLDQKIDALLTSRPIKPSDDFAARVLAATKAEETDAAAPTSKQSPVATIVRFALPLAAAIAVACVLVPMLKQGPVEPMQPVAPSNNIAQIETPASTAPNETNEIREDQLQEIFLLQEGLSALTLADNGDNLASDDLLNTLEALYYEI